MKIINLTKETKQDILSSLLKRSPNNYSQYEKTVSDIIENVKNNKDEAVCAYTKQFDGFDLTSQNIRVTEAEIEEAISSMDAEFVTVMENQQPISENIMKNRNVTVGLMPKKMVPFWARK